MPVFVLGSAVTGLVIEIYFSRRTAVGIAIVLLASGFVFASLNKTRSLVRWTHVEDVYQPRAVLYFSDQHENSASSFLAAAEAVNQSGCGEVAIDTYYDRTDIKNLPRSFFIYPMFALIHADGNKRSVICTGVHNATVRYANQMSRPAYCAVICVDCTGVQQEWAEYRAVGGRASVFDGIVIFSSTGTIPNNGYPPR